MTKTPWRLAWMMPPGQPLTRSDTALIATSGLRALEHVHQPRAVERRFHRVLPRLGQVQPPLVDGEPDGTAGRLFARCAVSTSPVEALVVERARHQVAQRRRPSRFCAVVVVDRQVVDGPAAPSAARCGSSHVVVADGDELDRRDRRRASPARSDVVARVGRGVGVAAHPVAPDLVADLPVLDAVRLRVPVGARASPRTSTSPARCSIRPRPRPPPPSRRALRR